MLAVSGMKFPMACGWKAHAESVIGALIVAAGGLLVARSTLETRQAVGIFSLALGALVILFPAVITGMCRLADNPCRQLILPALEVFWISVILIGGYLLWKRE